MAERPTCERCGKDAIGLQSLGCCVSYVCEDHADSSLHALKPGENRPMNIVTSNDSTRPDNN